MQPPPPDLSAPHLLRDHLTILREIMLVYQTSLVDEQDKESNFEPVLKTGLDPALNMCERMSAMKDIGGREAGKRLNTGVTFMTNCYIYILVSSFRTASRSFLILKQSVLEPFDFAALRCKQISDLIQSRVLILIEEQVSILSIC
jgi:conserved oligomeric Golgi complex subunit 6